ncbi:MAG: exonuclease SbcCD subunit D [Actinomycetota bacterium]|nr:exonuclease SbcCD subunit D [Actinomycetota bacterium]
MKLLHTADWHVGKALRGRSRADEHRAVLTEIAGIADAERVDLVLVAGDLFDSTAPPPEAERTVYRALLDLTDVGADVVVVAGNHDNPRRLEAVKPLLDLGRIHTGARVARPEAGGVVEVGTRSGETARLALLPFLSQRAIVDADALMSADADQHASAYAERAARVIAALSAGARDDVVNLLVAHLMVTGGTLGGGERAAHTIFDYCVPATAFPAWMHYVALGHLHRAQRVPAACPVWYAGSPLQLDFGETGDDKAVLVADVVPSRPAEVRPVALTAGRRLRTIRGSLDELEALAGTVGDDHLRVVVDEAPHPSLADEVRRRFDHAVDVIVAPPQARQERAAAGAEARRLAGSPTELFAAYLQERRADDEDLRRLFAELLDDQLTQDRDAPGRG